MPPRLRRLARILRLFWGTALAAEMEYRVNFAVAALTSLGNLAGSLFSLSLFYRGGYAFAGWTWEQALVVMGVFSVLEGLTACVLAPNLGRIVRHVEVGTLDFVLLKPLDAQLWLSTRDLSPWGLPDLVFGLALIAWAGARLGLGPLDYLAGVPALLLAAVALYALWFLLATTSVWFVKIYNITEVLRSLVDAGRFPMGAYPATLRLVFTFVVPVAFLTTVPAEALLGRGDPRWLAGSLALAILLLAATRAFWRFAMRHYTSASS